MSLQLKELLISFAKIMKKIEKVEFL